MKKTGVFFLFGGTEVERDIQREREREREREGGKVGAGLLLPWCYAAVAPVMLLQLLLGNSDGCCHVD